MSCVVGFARQNGRIWSSRRAGQLLRAKNWRRCHAAILLLPFNLLRQLGGSRSPDAKLTSHMHVYAMAMHIVGSLWACRSFTGTTTEMQFEGLLAQLSLPMHMCISHEHSVCVCAALAWLRTFTSIEGLEARPVSGVVVGAPSCTPCEKFAASDSAAVALSPRSAFATACTSSEQGLVGSVAVASHVLACTSP